MSSAVAEIKEKIQATLAPVVSLPQPEPQERVRSLEIEGPEALVICRILQKVEQDQDLGIPIGLIGGGTPQEIDQVIAQVAVGIRYLTKLEREGLL